MSKLLLSILLLLILTSQYLSANEQKKTLKVLTFNVWNLKILGTNIGKDIKERLKLIPMAIKTSGADIVALQENWKNSHRKLFSKKLKKLGYPYSFYLPRKLGMGDGLQIISKYPITASAVMKPFKNHTRFDEIFARKRAIYTEIEIAPGRQIDLFTLHAGALSYDEKDGSYKKKQKIRQAKQYQQFKKWFQANRRNNISLAIGDFNASYLNLAGGQFQQQFNNDYLKFLDNGCNDGEDLLDSYLIANSKDERSMQDATYDRENPYVASGFFSSAPSETEDYIFTCGISKEEIISSSVVFDEEISKEFAKKSKNDQLPVRLSDHYGILTELAIPTAVLH